MAEKLSRTDVVSLAASVQASRPGSQQQRVQLYQGPLVWSASKTSNSWKSCHYAERGYWDAAARKCVSWHFLVNLCIQLEMDPVSEKWRSSKRYGDVGCNVYQKYDPVASQKLQVTNWRVSKPPSIAMEQVWIPRDGSQSAPTSVCSTWWIMPLVVATMHSSMKADRLDPSLCLLKYLASYFQLCIKGTMCSITWLFSMMMVFLLNVFVGLCVSSAYWNSILRSSCKKRRVLNSILMN